MRVQGRVAQPSLRGRAVPGRRHGRGGHPARHLRDRRAPDRGAGLPALRRAVRRAQRATCSTGRCRGSGTTATRSACRPSGERSTSRVRTSRTASSTRWPSGWPRASGWCAAPPPASGNIVILFGASTGRDGIGGASVLASAELGETDEGKRPTVQVGDPFEEKKLLECSLELLDRGLLVSCRTSAPPVSRPRPRRWRPRARSGSTSTSRPFPCARGTWPRLRSWSPSRRSGCCASSTPESVQGVLEVCAKWEVHGTAIGSVTDSGRMRISPGPTSSGTCQCGRLWTTARCMTCTRRSPPRLSIPHRRPLCPRGLPARDPARAAVLSQHRLAQTAVRAVRRDRAVAHGLPSRAGRRRRAGDRSEREPRVTRRRDRRAHPRISPRRLCPRWR